MYMYMYVWIFSVDNIRKITTDSNINQIAFDKKKNSHFLLHAYVKNTKAIAHGMLIKKWTTSSI